jgi:protein-tyrosine phosphatase
MASSRHATSAPTRSRALTPENTDANTRCANAVKAGNDSDTNADVRSNLDLDLDLYLGVDENELDGSNLDDIADETTGLESATCPQQNQSQHLRHRSLPQKRLDIMHQARTPAMSLPVLPLLDFAAAGLDRSTHGFHSPHRPRAFNTHRSHSHHSHLPSAALDLDHRPALAKALEEAATASTSTSSPPLSPRSRAHALTVALSSLRPYLFLTCAATAASPLPPAVTHILNLAAASSPAHPHPLISPPLAYLPLGPADNTAAPLRNLSPLLETIACFIDSARDMGGTVVLHCKMGISRGPTAAAAYLIMREGMSANAAMAAVRAARPIADPNPSFIDLLTSLADRVRYGLPGLSLYTVEAHRPHADPLFLVALPVVPTPPPCTGRATSTRKRKRAILSSVSCSSFNDATPIARAAVAESDTSSGSSSTEILELDSSQVYIVARPSRRGVSVLHGPASPAFVRTRAEEIARTMADDEKRFHTLFPAVAGPGPFTCPVHVFGPDRWGDVAAMRPFMCALVGADDDGQVT